MLAHEARPRIGRPRQQGRAGGIGCMAYQAMVRNCSEKKIPSAHQLVRQDRTGSRRPFSEGATAPVCSGLHTNWRAPPR